MYLWCIGVSDRPKFLCRRIDGCRKGWRWIRKQDLSIADHSSLLGLGQWAVGSGGSGGEVEAGGGWRYGKWDGLREVAVGDAGLFYVVLSVVIT